MVASFETWDRNPTEQRCKLLPPHLEDLRRSGLTDQTIEAAGIYSEDDHRKVADMLNFGYAKARGPAMVFPFYGLDGHLNGYRRVKPLIPATDRKGRTVKYLSPKGSKNRAYFTKPAFVVLDDPSVELVVVEG